MTGKNTHFTFIILIVQVMLRSCSAPTLTGIFTLRSMSTITITLELHHTTTHTSLDLPTHINTSKQKNLNPQAEDTEKRSKPAPTQHKSDTIMFLLKQFLLSLLKTCLKGLKYKNMYLTSTKFVHSCVSRTKSNKVEQS